MIRILLNYYNTTAHVDRKILGINKFQLKTSRLDKGCLDQKCTLVVRICVLHSVNSFVVVFVKTSGKK